MTDWNAAVSAINWSAGSTIMIASGLRAAIRPMPERHGRRGVALGRFGENVLRREHRSHLADRIDLLGVGQDQDVLGRNQAVEAGDGLLEQGGVAEEVEQLFRPGIAAEGPEAGAGAAGEDQGVGGRWGGHCWAGG
jgi:hypothetical protein